MRIVPGVEVAVNLSFAPDGERTTMPLASTSGSAATSRAGGTWTVRMVSFAPSRAAREKVRRGLPFNRSAKCAPPTLAGVGAGGTTFGAGGTVVAGGGGGAGGGARGQSEGP